MRIKISLLSFILFYVIFLNVIQAADNIKIKLLYLPQNISVIQGGSIKTRVVIENIHNNSIEWVVLKTTTPSGIIISVSPKEIDLLGKNQRLNFNLEIDTDQNLANDTYQIQMGAESETEIDGNKIKSETYVFNLTVLPKPITTTTQNVSTTIQTTTLNDDLLSTTTTGPSITPKTIIQEKVSGGGLRSKIFLIIIVTLIVFAVVFALIVTSKKIIVRCRR